jgi:hypothetical protein
MLAAGAVPNWLPALVVAVGTVVALWFLRRR